MAQSATEAPPIRCVTYSRISLDAHGTGLGVARQGEANRKIAHARQWEIVHEYVDNDISATDRRKIRPQYNAMVQAFERGEFQALICWDLDRLTRQPRQLEDWIEAAETKGLLLTTASGEADLTTDSGRLFARIKLAVARGEVERKSARQKAAHAQRVASGLPWKGSRRAFGFKADNTHFPEEAEAARNMYDEVLRGTSLTTIAATLNQASLLTTMGQPWTPAGVRQFLQNPRNAGMIAHRDVIAGKGTWEPIVGEDKWRAVNGILSANPHGRDRAGTHLLSMLLDCGHCGTPMTAGYRHNRTRIYRCPACTKISRNADHCDTYITAIVTARLDLPDAKRLLVDNDAPDTARLQDEARVLQLRLEQLAEAFADGDIGPREWKAARDRIEENLKATEAQITLNSSASVLGPLVDAPDAEEAWDSLELARRRAVIRTLLAITVLPTQRGSRFNPAHVRVEWKQV